MVGVGATVGVGVAGGGLGGGVELHAASSRLSTTPTLMERPERTVNASPSIWSDAGHGGRLERELWLGRNAPGCPPRL